MSSGALLAGDSKAGDADVKQRLAEFALPTDLTGKRVLDAETGDGRVAFELGERGADVLAIDSCDDPRFDEMRDSRGLENRVERRLMSVYDITPELLGHFDVVTFIDGLRHLKHPLLGLERLCSVTREMACISSLVLREPHRVDLPFEGRVIMEFFETDEFGGNIDNWVLPTASCLAAFCRTAGFARTELVGNPPFGASIACHRHWMPPPPDWTLEPVLIDAVHHIDFGVNFSRRRDDYIVVWFSVERDHLSIHDVFPEVSGWGIRPIHVDRHDAYWLTTFKLPPGLDPGWHEVRLHVKGSRVSAPLKIAVDLPLPAANIVITAAADGVTWKPDEIDLSVGTMMSLSVKGLPDSADRRCFSARVDRQLTPITYIGPVQDGERQMNVVMPALSTGDSIIEITIGSAKAQRRIRVIG